MNKYEPRYSLFDALKSQYQNLLAVGPAQPAAGVAPILATNSGLLAVGPAQLAAGVALILATNSA